MFFSPIAEKTLRVRGLYLVIYTLLTLGAITVLAPLLIMVTGSVSPTNSTKVNLVPAWLTNDTAFWRDYLAAKYNQSVPALRQAWGDPDADFLRGEKPPVGDTERLALWDAFQREDTWRGFDFACGFFGTSRLPQYNQRNFRHWLLDRFDHDLARLNRTLGAEFANVNVIKPTNVSLTGASFVAGLVEEEFFTFLREEAPASQRIPMNAGGFYRAVFLPQAVGRDVGEFNARYGTDYASYDEVPFPATAPEVAGDQWFLFVSKALRPNFVTWTESGRTHFEASGMHKDDFIRQRARPEDLRVDSIDLRFVAWAAERGVAVAGIPQRDLDLRSFAAERSHWRGVFLTQNYAVVLDEILINGRAIANTLILVILSVTGTLLINPMAAYALSRYRPRMTYQIILFCLVTIALPGEVTMIPVFLQLKELGLLNTFGALVIPGLASGFSIFLLKGFFDSLPRDLYEAAELDGASEVTIFWLVTMNLSRPILAVLALSAFTAAYGTFMYALILCPDPRMWTIMVYLFQLMQSVNAPILYAALILASIPTILIFVFCQNIILRGIVVPAEK